MIRDVSVLDEAEASMISKVKQICSVEYTNKLQRMFKGAHIPLALHIYLN